MSWQNKDLITLLDLPSVHVRVRFCTGLQSRFRLKFQGGKDWWLLESPHTGFLPVSMFMAEFVASSGEYVDGGPCCHQPSLRWHPTLTCRRLEAAPRSHTGEPGRPPRLPHTAPSCQTAGAWPPGLPELTCTLAAGGAAAL